MSDISAVYCAGGVIGSNPSAIGGTYAWRFVYDDDHLPMGAASVLTAAENGGEVTNNQTEMMAVLTALSRVPDNWAGTVYSDSQVTLGRLFQGWKWTNIPPAMHRLFQEQRRRLINWEKIRYVLLDGHPTKAQLSSGYGKRGHPVSEHNVWCDEACREAADSWLNAQMVLGELAEVRA